MPIDLRITNRNSSGIADDNEFLYATKSSHFSGWHVVSTNCEAADVSSVSATKNGHRASTVYASLIVCKRQENILRSFRA